MYEEFTVRWIFKVQLHFVLIWVMLLKREVTGCFQIMESYNLPGILGFQN